MRQLTLAMALTLIACNHPVLADWPQFRGPNSSGIADGAAPPIEFGPGKNELWRIPMGAGHSSPCIVGKSIFLTTQNEEKKELAVVRIARDGGKILWKRPIAVEEFEKGHPSFSPASSTPASDGEIVVAYFGTFGLVCFDLDGKKLWDLKLPTAKSYGGNAISPVIVGDKVILYRGNYVDHFLLALDKKSGKEIWKTPLTEKCTPDMACTATPIVLGKQLILHSARAVQSFDIASGKNNWEAHCKTTATSTPIIAGDEILVATWNQTGEPDQVPQLPSYEELVKENDKDGDKTIVKKEFPKLMVFHRSEGTEAPENGFPIRFRMVDKDKDGKLGKDEWEKFRKERDSWRKRYVPHGLLAIKADSKGTVDFEAVRVLERQGIPEVPSPIYHDGRVYVVKNGGILTCIDLKSGKRLYRMRTKGRGTHYASPIAADGKLFTIAGDGRITVLEMGSKAKILATNDVGERVYATPAIVDGVLYVRTHKSLIAFGASKD